METIDKIIEDAIHKATTERGHINIVIAGRSGVGKSTLINAVFQANMATTGQGKPVTQNTKEISKDGIPLTIFDTKGLEMLDFEKTISDLEQLVSKRCSDKDPNQHIHLAWLCIGEDGRRVEDGEVKLHKILSKHIPIIAVITKARSDNGFSVAVKNLLPQSNNVIRVRAIQEELDEGMILKPMGLADLIELSSEYIPEGKKRAFAASQKANIAYKKKEAHKIVVTAAITAAAAGAVPIPFSDAVLLAPIQIGMIAGITSVFGLDISEGSLATLASSAIGVTGGTLAGRAIVTNLLKFIPGAGTAVGGAIAATTAAMLTTALGEAYISVLDVIFSNNPDANPEPSEIAELLKKKMKSK